jgi:hypothetical protein
MECGLELHYHLKAEIASFAFVLWRWRFARHGTDYPDRYDREITTWREKTLEGRLLLYFICI